jgi:hypothetical protein
MGGSRSDPDRRPQRRHAAQRINVIGAPDASQPRSGYISGANPEKSAEETPTCFRSERSSKYRRPMKHCLGAQRRSPLPNGILSTAMRSQARIPKG